MLQLVVGESTLTLMRGDITQVEAGAIVNAANSSLMGGGGVDGAIHRVGGGSIQAECRSIVAATGRLQPGHAVATTAGRLHARYVIHTVGPVWQDGSHGEADVLASCYREALSLAHSLSIESIAFPSISTGAYRYPVDRAAAIGLSEVIGFLGSRSHHVRRVTFVLYDDETLSTYERILRTLPPGTHSR